MNEDVVVAGIGMIPFKKPGTNEPYPLMASTATRTALSDARVDFADIEQAYVGYVYGDSTAGQRAVY
jgi:acetyl-CoA acetyltransferase